MASTTVAQLAAELNRPAAALLEQLNAAGVGKASPADAVTETDKARLLDHLRSSHGTVAGAERKKITLTRKSTSEIKQADATGKARTIQVEVRKKRTFVKRDDAPAADEGAAQAEAEAREAELARREEEARVEAEKLRLQEEELREQQRKREAQEKAEREAAEIRAREAAARAAEAEAATRAAAEASKAAPAKAKAAAEAKAAEEAKAAADAAAAKPVEAAGDAKPAEAAKPALRVVKAGTLASEEQARAADLARRRKAAEDEAAAIRNMMATPKKVLVAKKPEEAKPAEAKEAIKGTIHKKAGAPGTAAPATAAKPGDKKSIKSEKLSSSWADDAAKKRAQKAAPRGAPGAGGRPGWRAPRSGRRGDRTDDTTPSFNPPAEFQAQEVHIPETISVADLAHKMSVKASEVIKQMMKLGQMVTINQQLDQETAMIVVEEMGHTALAAKLDDPEAFLEEEATEGQHELKPRAPVVTVMGHVDHGKTSLLDHIRRTRVASGEAGGITQHIGAYHVETPKGVISFLDTPGHAAFTHMRQRGAKLTDIVILVVAADDGVMPQTIEAIQHAKSAKVPLIVAINKIDKSDADPSRVKNDLLAHDVVAEEFGGDTQMVELSARTGDGVDDLLDAISLQAEVLDLKAVFEGRASGVVIESALDKGRGPVATVLVQQGTLSKGDYLVCGIQYGRVRALFDETGSQVPSAGPSIPVQILGLSGVPEAGDDFVVVADERLAKDVAQQRDAKRRESRLVAAAGNRMEDIMAQMGEGASQQTLNLVVKADVHGSVQALREALTGLSNDQIRINVIGSGVGGITESDAQLAATSKATVIGFNVRADASARKVIENNGTDLRYFSIIYDVIDQVKQVASNVLGKEIREEIIGIAEVRDVFRSSKFGAVAGCMVVEGVVKKSKPIRVLRDSVVIFEGELESLRRFKENVDEVRVNTECGIGVKAYNDVKPGDQIECFERIEVQRTL